MGKCSRQDAAHWVVLEGWRCCGAHTRERGPSHTWHSAHGLDELWGNLAWTQANGGSVPAGRFPKALRGWIVVVALQAGRHPVTKCFPALPVNCSAQATLDDGAPGLAGQVKLWGARPQDTPQAWGGGCCTEGGAPEASIPGAQEGFLPQLPIT